MLHISNVYFCIHFFSSGRFSSFLTLRIVNELDSRLLSANFHLCHLWNTRSIHVIGDSQLNVCIDSMKICSSHSRSHKMFPQEIRRSLKCYKIIVGR